MENEENRKAGCYSRNEFIAEFQKKYDGADALLEMQELELNDAIRMLCLDAIKFQGDIDLYKTGTEKPIGTARKDGTFELGDRGLILDGINFRIVKLPEIRATE